MLSKDLKVKCPRCDAVSNITDWDDFSYSECLTRQMRRAYMSLLSEKAFNPQSDYAYECPKCRNWVRGSQLIIESDDPKLKRLGRRPLTTVHGQKIIRPKI